MKSVFYRSWDCQRGKIICFFRKREFSILSVMSYAIDAFDITTLVGAVRGWGSIFGQNSEQHCKMVINLWILIEIYIPIPSTNGLVSGKNCRKNTGHRPRIHGKILGKSGEDGEDVSFLQRDSDGMTPFLSEVTSAWHSCELVQGVGPHALLWQHFEML